MREGQVFRMLAFAAFTACVGMWLAGCSGDRAAPNEPARRRVITVGGAVTETAYALGIGDEIVAVDTSSVYPQAVDGLPRVGYQRTLAAEVLLAHRPDLVVVSAEAGPATTFAQLREAGVIVERVPDAATIEQAATRVLAIGAVLGRSREAAALATRIRGDGTDASRTIPAGPRPRALVVYARGGGMMMVAGDDTPASAMLQLAGADAAVSNIRGYKPLSPEVLIAAAPDVIVIPSRGLATLGGEAGLLSVPGMRDTPAGRARRIVAYDDLLLLGFGPRLPAAISELATKLRAGT